MTVKIINLTILVIYSLSLLSWRFIQLPGDKFRNVGSEEDIHIYGGNHNYFEQHPIWGIYEIIYEVYTVFVGPDP